MTTPLSDTVTDRPEGLSSGGRSAKLARHGVTLLEQDFPYVEVSTLVDAGRRSTDPAHLPHRWWARRPPAMLRAVLLAATLPDSATRERLWALYNDPGAHLEGLTVFDPFAGGGTTLVEAVRLGANVAGGDVDPVSVAITTHLVDPPPQDSYERAANRLLRDLMTRHGHLYLAEGPWIPLHYFYLSRVTCPSCDTPDLLYRSPVLARDVGKPGSVRRDHPIVCFCPSCLMVHSLDRSDRVELRCCSRRWRLDEGTFERHRFTCPSCGLRVSHGELQTGTAPLELIAVESTGPGRRRIDAPSKEARSSASRSVTTAENDEDLYPRGALSTDRRDARPRSFGITRHAQMYTARQRAVFGAAFNWIEMADVDKCVRRALQLAVSNALTTNNRLCSYATDYGRLAPLFAVRGYSMPSLTVELNPLHPTGGRGTLINTIQRVADSLEQTVRRRVWATFDNRAELHTFDFHMNGARKDIRLASADRPAENWVLADVCVFDPPYFDFIAYSELSEVYRAWWPNAELAGDPLLPNDDDPVSSFAHRFAACLNATLRQVAPRRPVVFTYHSANPDAWESLGRALDTAQLRCTALWPVRTDGHMGHHSFDATCRWDLLVVCRRAGETVASECELTVDEWLNELATFEVGDADVTNFTLAIEMASRRWATPAEVG